MRTDSALSTTQAKDNLKNIFKSVRPSYQDFFYRFQRNNFTFSMALFYSHTPLDKAIFTQSIRTTDEVIKVNNNLYCIIFDTASGEKGFKASQNILSHYETKYFSQKLYISYADTEEYPYEELIFSHLKSFLDYAIKEDLYNQVIDGYHELETI